MRATAAALLLMTAITPSLLAGPTGPAGALDAPGTSTGGVLPVVYAEGGGNVECVGIAELDGLVASDDLASSDRRNWTGAGFDGADWPDGVSVTVTDGTSVTWSSSGFPLAAVIVKGGAAANVYVYAGLEADVFADSGLVAPTNASGGPAGLSNLTLCWDMSWTPPDEPDLAQLCLQAAADAGITGIAWVSGTVRIRDGVVDTATVPDDFVITFDPMDEQIGFVAPDPVAMVVTAASTAVTHRIDPPSTTGSVPLSSNPGDGDVVLCGLAGAPPVVEELSCDLVPGTTVLGPIPVVDGTVDPADLPTSITAIMPDTTSIAFTATQPVAAVIVVASPPLLHEFEPEVLEGSVDATVTDEPVDLYFCVRPVSDGPDDPTDPGDPVDPVDAADPDDADDPVFGTLVDPSSIPTGGGPSGRTTLALVAFVVLALAGSTTLLLWSRGVDG